MSRYRAFAIHLLLCVFVGTTLLALFWFVWYPVPLFEAIGGIDIFLMLLAVDVVLGPMLTLLVFKPGKKSLKFDLTVIATVQIAALCYGVFTLLVARPVFIAALGHRFDVVQANAVADSDIEASGRALPRFGPLWVGIRPAADPKERERVMLAGATSGLDYGHFPQYHQPLREMRDELLKNAQPIRDLKKLNPEHESALDQWLLARGATPDTVRFLGLKAVSKDMAVILDAKTAEVIGIAPFRPW